VPQESVFYAVEAESGSSGDMVDVLNSALSAISLWGHA